MPTTKAQQKAVAKYMKNNYDELKIRIKKGDKELFKAYAESQGKSLNSYIADLMYADIRKSAVEEETDV